MQRLYLGVALFLTHAMREVFQQAPQALTLWMPVCSHCSVAW